MVIEVNEEVREQGKGSPAQMPQSRLSQWPEAGKTKFHMHVMHMYVYRCTYNMYMYMGVYWTYHSYGECVVQLLGDETNES